MPPCRRRPQYIRHPNSQYHKFNHTEKVQPAGALRRHQLSLGGLFCSAEKRRDGVHGPYTRRRRRNASPCKTALPFSRIQSFQILIPSEVGSQRSALPCACAQVLLLEKLECPTWRATARGISGGECFGW